MIVVSVPLKQNLPGQSPEQVHLQVSLITFEEWSFFSLGHFPGGPLVKIPHLEVQVWYRVWTKTPYALQYSQNQNLAKKKKINFIKKNFE